MNEIRITTKHTKTAEDAVREANTQLAELNTWLEANGLPLLKFAFRTQMYANFIQEMIPWKFSGEFLAWDEKKRHLCNHPNMMFGDLNDYRFVTPNEVPQLWGSATFHGRARGRLGGATQSETLGYRLLKKFVPHTVEVKYGGDWNASYEYDVCTPLV